MALVISSQSILRPVLFSRAVRAVPVCPPLWRILFLLRAQGHSAVVLVHPDMDVGAKLWQIMPPNGLVIGRNNISLSTPMSFQTYGAVAEF